MSSSRALDEELARAEMYGLLAQLFYQPPSPELLAQLQVAVTEAPDAGGFLEEPWQALVAAARVSDVVQITAEFNSLFGGVGKPEVYLFGSHYLSGFLNEKPLVRLRDDLAALGLARSEQMSETEDHVAYLFEVMRFLIAGDDAGVSNLTRQFGFLDVMCSPGFRPCARLCRGIRERSSTLVWPRSPKRSWLWKPRASICSMARIEEISLPFTGLP